MMIFNGDLLDELGIVEFHQNYDDNYLAKYEMYFENGYGVSIIDEKRIRRRSWWSKDYNPNKHNNKYELVILKLKDGKWMLDWELPKTVYSHLDGDESKFADVITQVAEKINPDFEKNKKLFNKFEEHILEYQGK